MTARITANLTADGEELEIWLNAEGRDLLIRELEQLSEKCDHFHLGPYQNGEIELSSRPYRADDKIIQHGKIYFRTDAWDRQYYPHVLNTSG